MGIGFFNKEKEKQIPQEFKQIAKDFSEKGFVTTSSENLINWARTGSLHWMTFGLACCAVEMMQTSMPRYDLEIAFLFPWAISLGSIGILGFTSMMLFLFILTVGFIYEWKKGALEWE